LKSGVNTSAKIHSSHLLVCARVPVVSLRAPESMRRRQSGSASARSRSARVRRNSSSQPGYMSSRNPLSKLTQVVLACAATSGTTRPPRAAA